MLPYSEGKVTKIALGIFFVLIALYGLYEAHGILFGPSIEISGRAMLVYQPYIEIKGKADRISSLSMNGFDIPVTENGAFDEPYVLSPGYNRIVLDAKDRYGKTAERVIEIIYEASTTPAMTTASSTPTAQTRPATSSTSSVAH